MNPLLLLLPLLSDHKFPRPSKPWPNADILVHHLSSLKTIWSGYHHVPRPGRAIWPVVCSAESNYSSAGNLYLRSGLYGRMPRVDGLMSRSFYHTSSSTTSLNSFFDCRDNPSSYFFHQDGTIRSFTIQIFDVTETRNLLRRLWLMNRVHMCIVMIVLSQWTCNRLYFMNTNHLPK